MPAPVDISGQRFGRLRVVERAAIRRHDAHWKAVCDCGNECVVMGSNLRRGLQISCGCKRRENTANLPKVRPLDDLAGRRFGRLVAVELAEPFGRSRGWMCRCDCGGQKVVRAASLKNGATRSCGCVKPRISIPGERLTGLRKYRSERSAMSRARKRGVAHEHVDLIAVLIAGNWRCYVCGIETPEALRGTLEPNAPEVDHIVPLARGGGHIAGNLACICMRCNRVKHAKLPESFDNRTVTL